MFCPRKTFVSVPSWGDKKKTYSQTNYIQRVCSSNDKVFTSSCFPPSKMCCVRRKVEKKIQEKKWGALKDRRSIILQIQVWRKKSFISLRNSENIIKISWNPKSFVVFSLDIDVPTYFLSIGEKYWRSHCVKVETVEQMKLTYEPSKRKSKWEICVQLNIVLLLQL